MGNAIKHEFDVGVLVEIDDGVRLFVAEHTRDCDGAPLYSLSPFKHGDLDFIPLVRGISDMDMRDT